VTNSVGLPSFYCIYDVPSFTVRKISFFTRSVQLIMSVRADLNKMDWCSGLLVSIITSHLKHPVSSAAVATDRKIKE
jgi:hypothetical protein